MNLQKESIEGFSKNIHGAISGETQRNGVLRLIPGVIPENVAKKNSKGNYAFSKGIPRRIPDELLKVTSKGVPGRISQKCRVESSTRH